MERPARVATLSASVIAIVTATTLVASPAHAAPWDGADIEFGVGVWEAHNSEFRLTDIDLVFPDDSIVATDIWDAAGVTRIDSASLGLSNANPACNTDADVDIESPEAATGDLVYRCSNNFDADIIAAGLDVDMEIRVLEGGEIARFWTSITNTTDDEVTIDRVRVWTNFGSSGLLWDYENQADSILAVPASELVDDVQAALNEAESRWIVHWNALDAPGSFIVGNGGASAPVTWFSTSSDEYRVGIGPFSIPAGETRSVVTFATWSPQQLIDGGFTGAAGDDEYEAATLNASADAIVATMADFTELEGVLASGISDLTTVVNWGLAPTAEPEPEPESELADSGVSDATAFGLAALLLLGAGIVLVVLRRAIL